jgi:hypothetical protein
MAKDKKTDKKKKKTDSIEAPQKEGGLFWLAVAIILGLLAFVWLVKSFGPKTEGVPDESLVRAVVRGQFDAVFNKDIDTFLGYHSADYDSGEMNYEDKAEMLQELIDNEFVVKDFTIEYLKTGDDQVDVHFDEARGFASVLVYTYWKQRTGDSITRKPVMQLNSFLLRKEGEDWKIIADKSRTLNKKEDAETWIKSSHFRQYADPTTFVWPPPRATEAPVQSKPPEAPEAESAQGEDAVETGGAEGVEGE